MGRDVVAVRAGSEALRGAAIPDAVGCPRPLDALSGLVRPCPALSSSGPGPGPGPGPARRPPPVTESPGGSCDAASLRDAVGDQPQANPELRNPGASPAAQCAVTGAAAQSAGIESGSASCRDCSAARHVVQSGMRQSRSRTQLRQVCAIAFSTCSAIAAGHVRCAISLPCDSRAVAAIAPAAMSRRTMRAARKELREIAEIASNKVFFAAIAFPAITLWRMDRRCKYTQESVRDGE